MTAAAAESAAAAERRTRGSGDGRRCGWPPHSWVGACGIRGTDSSHKQDRGALPHYIGRSPMTRIPILLVLLAVGGCAAYEPVMTMASPGKTVRVGATQPKS